MKKLDIRASLLGKERRAAWQRTVAIVYIACFLLGLFNTRIQQIAWVQANCMGGRQGSLLTELI
jgi:hypothetical protein